MMPDLGIYATEVLLAYAVSLLLLAGLIGWFWAHGAAVRRALTLIESRNNRTL